MKVKLLGGVVEGPSASPEHAYPVVWSFILCRTTFPNVVVSIRVFVILFALQEPWVFIRRVIRNEPHDYLDAFLVSLFDKFVEVFHGSEHGIDGRIIFHIVNRVKPHSLYSQLSEVIHLVQDTFQIAISISTRVFERTRIHLVNDTMF